MNTLGLIVFILVLIVELAFINGLSVLNQGIAQLSEINIFNQPKLSFFIYHNCLEVCVNNTESFPITICTIKGKEITLPTQQTIPAFTAKNITLLIKNYQEFESNLKNDNCVVFIKIHFLNVTSCMSEKI